MLTGTRGTTVPASPAMFTKEAVCNPTGSTASLEVRVATTCDFRARDKRTVDRTGPVRVKLWVMISLRKLCI